jgi:hypothetical protein
LAVLCVVTRLSFAFEEHTVAQQLELLRGLSIQPMSPWKRGGATPMTVNDVPPSSTGRPMASSRPSRWVRQKYSVTTATGAAAASQDLTFALLKDLGWKP